MKNWRMWVFAGVLLCSAAVFGFIRAGKISMERLRIGDRRPALAVVGTSKKPVEREGERASTPALNGTGAAPDKKSDGETASAGPDKSRNDDAPAGKTNGDTIVSAINTATTNTITSTTMKREDDAENKIPLQVQVVWKSNGTPVAEAEIRCTAPKEKPDGAGRVLDKAKTGREGSVVLALDRGLTFAWLHVNHPGAINVGQRVTLPAAGPVVIRLDPGYSVFGTVYREREGKNQPVSGAKVTASYAGAPTATSGKDGKYHLTGLSKSEVDLVAKFGWQRTPSSRGERNLARLAPQGPNGPYDLYMKRALDLTGAVLDKASGKPIAGAQITAFASLNRESTRQFDNSSLDQKVATGEDGTFTIHNLPDGTLKLRALAEGYGEVFKEIPIERGKDNTIVLEMSGGGAIEVTGIDRDGDPVAAAVLNVRREGGHYWAGTTDKDGKITLDNVKWNVPYSVMLWKYSSQGTGYKEVTLKTGEKKAEVTLQFNFKNSEVEGKGVITGAVRDERGQGVGGATVRCQQGWAVASNSHWQTGITNLAGQYRIEVPAAEGGYYMCVNAEGYAPAWAEGVIFGTGEKPGVRDFTLKQAHWISGTVLDEGGRPLAGVVVRAMPADGGIFSFAGHPGMTEQVTAADGTFVMKNLSGPQVIIRARKSGWKLDAPGPVKVDQAVQLKMQPAGEIRGIVMNDGKRVPEFSVRIMGPDVESGAEPAYDGRGGFRMGDLTRGAGYRVEIEAVGYEKLSMTAAAEAGGGVMKFSLAPSTGTPLNP